MEEENFLADIPREGESVEDILNSVDKELQEETPAESLPEKLDLPDESILKKNEAWEEMRKSKEELEARLEALEKDSKGKQVETVEQPEFLTKMIGENEEVAKDWMREKATIKEQVKQELLQEQIDAQKKEAETKEYWNKWTEEQFAKVGVKDQNERNELAKVMNDYTPTDEQGNLDYTKGKKLLNDLKKAQAEVETQKIQVKKNLADASVSNETSVQKNKGFLTSHDFRGKDWRQMVHED